MSGCPARAALPRQPSTTRRIYLQSLRTQLAQSRYLARLLAATCPRYHLYRLTGCALLPNRMQTSPALTR